MGVEEPEHVLGEVSRLAMFPDLQKLHQCSPEAAARGASQIPSVLVC